MSATFDVVVVGELNADLILRGDVTPAFGQVERLVDDATLTIGSSSAITACGLARLGLRVAFTSLVGDDVFGRFMCESLSSYGIDISGVRVDPDVNTGLSVILSRGNDRAILTAPGSIAALCYAHVDRSLVQRARHLHLGAYFLLTGLQPDVPKLFAEAQAAGMTVSLDTNYDPSERWAGLAPVLAHTDILLPNEVELLAISGADSLDAGLDQLVRQVPTVVVKRGAAGASARRTATFVTARTRPVDVVDTTGAGDSFNAGFLYGHLAGWNLERSLQFACVCGAHSTQAAGGTAAQPTLAQALAWME